MTPSIRSMTGFGLSEINDEKIFLSVQVKSVNGRFLESRFRLPREYQSLEIELKKILNEFFSRGTVEVSINRTFNEAAMAAEVKVNETLARAWLKAYQQLGKALNLEAQPGLQMITHVPGVMEIEDTAQITEWEKVHVIKTFRQACEACLEERRREGRALAKILSDLLDQLEEFVLHVQKHRKTLNEKLHQKLKARLNELNAEVFVDPQRLAQEVLFAVEHSDVEEEVERALTHIKNYRKQLTLKESLGKKLEFYTQELHREVNTMGSKANDLGLTEKIIDAKAIVERLREQVQNVE